VCSFVAQQEQQKIMFHDLVSKITANCFDKCMGSPGTKLSGSESSCFQYCAARYLESSQMVSQRLSSMK
jgi:import inner membrane translocase subunit TIM8